MCKIWVSNSLWMDEGDDDLSFKFTRSLLVMENKKNDILVDIAKLPSSLFVLNEKCFPFLLKKLIIIQFLWKIAFMVKLFSHSSSLSIYHYRGEMKERRYSQRKWILMWKRFFFQLPSTHKSTKISQSTTTLFPRTPFASHVNRTTGFDCVTRDF